MPDSPIITDGSLSFSGGVNSLAPTTVQSDVNPSGLPKDALSWLDNATVRDGGISPRAGWRKLGKIKDGDGFFQGAFMYHPFQANPYIIASIGGHIYKIDPDTGAADDLTEAFPLNSPQFNPDTETQAYFVQAEQFLVIQAGDGQTLPFFWDGNILRRSKGITNTALGASTNGVNEIPAAGPMEYYMGRIWYAQDRTVCAGDIVRGPSGSLPYNFVDAVLNVTENPLVVGGDGFTVPSNDGSIIRGIKYSANLDQSLGQGRLFIGTRKAVYVLDVPVTRANWIAADGNNQPKMAVAQLNNGWVNDRSVVAVNGDLFYQALEPSIRSMIQGSRSFETWGNVPISANMNRLLMFNDRALLRHGSGIYFDNRLLQTSLPMHTEQGVVHQALAVLDFMPVSYFGQQKQPCWEGMYEGLNMLQLLMGDFGGRERAFTLTVNETTRDFDLWELTSSSRFDGDLDDSEKRITWVIETPAFTWDMLLQLKRLESMELWVDRLFGTVQFAVEYRPDAYQCWLPWHTWKKCTTRHSKENVVTPYQYPLDNCLDSYVANMTLPKPPVVCTPSGRNSDIGYQFQVRIIIIGYCRVRGIYLHATPYSQKLYANMTCPPLRDGIGYQLPDLPRNSEGEPQPEPELEPETEPTPEPDNQPPDGGGDVGGGDNGDNGDGGNHGGTDCDSILSNAQPNDPSDTSNGGTMSFNYASKKITVTGSSNGEGTYAEGEYELVLNNEAGGMYCCFHLKATSTNDTDTDCGGYWEIYGGETGSDFWVGGYGPAEGSYTFPIGEGQNIIKVYLYCPHSSVGGDFAHCTGDNGMTLEIEFVECQGGEEMVGGGGS